MAHAARVPILPIAFDAERRAIRLFAPFTTSGDYDGPAAPACDFRRNPGSAVLGFGLGVAHQQAFDLRRCKAALDQVTALRDGHVHLFRSGELRHALGAHALGDMAEVARIWSVFLGEFGRRAGCATGRLAVRSSRPRRQAHEGLGCAAKRHAGA